MFTGMKGWSPQNSMPNSIAGTPANNPDSKKSASPPISDEEMLKKVQYMISLQVAATQDQPLPSTASSVSSPTQHGSISSSPGIIPDSSGFEGASITPAAAAELKAAAAATGRRFARASEEKPPPAPRPPPPPPPPPMQSAQEPQAKSRSIMGSIPFPDYAATSSSGGPNTDTQQQQQQMADVGVGQGHLYFPGEYQQQQYSREEQHPMLGDGSNLPHYGLEQEHLSNPYHDVVHPDHVEPEPSQEDKLSCGCWQACVNSWKHAANDSLHQSFCFASIDGMLTGAGLVAAFLGMGVLNPRKELHYFVVALTLAACFSDALCMAVGHVWSTFVLTHASAKERRMERTSFETSRADSKAKLVDLLLTRGMLKIDAMSIADTLEGYPDIFVSTLVGDAGLLLGEDALLPSSPSMLEHEHNAFSPLLRARQSHGGLLHVEQEALDPEASSVKLALAESRKEGLIMMMSFTIFSVVPSLIFTWLSHVMNVSVKHRASGGTSVTSIAVSLSSLIMLLLGFWKSRFFAESHWILFGIETVVVLWMCTLSAYFIGYGLSLAIPGLRGILAINQG